MDHTATPWKQTLGSDGYLRQFSASTHAKELIWHTDLKDRTIEVLSSSRGWQFQFDDAMPVNLHQGMQIRIPVGVYHRLIKGTVTGDLILNIIE
jgi:hypothetical protein